VLEYLKSTKMWSAWAKYSCCGVDKEAEGSAGHAETGISVRPQIRQPNSDWLVCIAHNASKYCGEYSGFIYHIEILSVGVPRSISFSKDSC
jgi:hypothetical protein